MIRDAEDYGSERNLPRLPCGVTSAEAQRIPVSALAGIWLVALLFCATFAHLIAVAIAYWF